MAVGAPILEVSEISVRFAGLQALDRVSAVIPAGSVIGIIGPNGAGKTTLFNVVCGFITPDQGTLTLRGAPLRGHSPKDLTRLRIARTLQGLGLFPQLTALDNVMVGATRFARAGVLAGLLALPRSDRDERALRERAMAALDQVGVADAAPRLPRQLPYGVQKRVALARALVAEPELLLLDEPASGLAADEMRELGALIRAWREHTSVVLVEHHMDLVMSVCDSIVVLDFGRVIATGTSEQVRDDPLVLQAYLGEEVSDARGA